MLLPETTQWLPPSSSLRTDGRDRGRKRYKQITRPRWYRCTCTKYHRQTNEALQNYNSRTPATLTSQAQPTTERIAFSILARLSMQPMARMYLFRSWTGLRWCTITGKLMELNTPTHPKESSQGSFHPCNTRLGLYLLRN